MIWRSVRCMAIGGKVRADFVTLLKPSRACPVIAVAIGVETDGARTLAAMNSVQPSRAMALRP